MFEQYPAPGTTPRPLLDYPVLPNKVGAQTSSSNPKLTQLANTRLGPMRNGLFYKLSSESTHDCHGRTLP